MAIPGGYVQSVMGAIYVSKGRECDSCKAVHRLLYVFFDELRLRRDLHICESCIQEHLARFQEDTPRHDESD